MKELMKEMNLETSLTPNETNKWRTRLKVNTIVINIENNSCYGYFYYYTSARSVYLPYMAIL